MTDPLLLVKVLLLIGVSNGVPVLATRLFKNKLAAPLDGGVPFIDGRPLLGEGKTIRGLVASIIVTALIGPLLGFDMSLAAGVAALSMFGDLLSSFVKRRLRLGVHAQAFGLDQIPEALLPLWVFQEELGLSASGVVFVVLAFVLLSVLLSRVLYKLGIRDHPY